MMMKPLNWCAVLGACAIGLAASAGAQAGDWSKRSARAPQPKAESLRQMWRNDEAISQRDGLTDYGEKSAASGKRSTPRGLARAATTNKSIRTPRAKTQRRANAGRIDPRTRSLRNLWRSDPSLSARDGLTDYGEDVAADKGASGRESSSAQAGPSGDDGPSSPEPLFHIATSNKRIGSARAQEPRKAEPVDPRTAKLREMWRSDPSLSQSDELTDY